jgi:hypothetical protein
MARLIGTSGAWRKIQDELAEIGLRAERPEELSALLTEQKSQLGQKMAEAQGKIDGALAPLAAEIQIQKENIEKGPAERLAELEKDIQQAQLHLEMYRLDKGIVGRLSNRFRIRRVETKLHKLEQDRDEITGRVKRLLGEQEAILAEKRAAVEAEAIGDYKLINSQVAILQQTLESPELAEAVIELEMRSHLEKLPATATVISGLELEADSAVRLEGKSFWSGKINHLVITPSGLFAIEVQQGGKHSASESDPFEQIRRATHLCHELLKYDFPGITVRAVLAHRSPLPEGQQNAYVKTLPFPEVSGYINWFKDNSLSADRIEKIVASLQEMTR